MEPVEVDHLSGSVFQMTHPFEVRKSIDQDGRRIIEGIVSTPDEDLEGERIDENSTYQYFLRRAAVNKALLDRFDWSSIEHRHGFLKYEHSADAAHACRSCGGACFREPETIIGYPVEIEKSVAFSGPDGYPRVGTRMVAELFPAEAKNPFADAAWLLLNSIEKSATKRRLGFSVEGAYLDQLPGARKAQPDTSKSILVTNVVLTTKPVNQHTQVWTSLRKSLLGCIRGVCMCLDCRKAVTAGPATTDPAAMTGGQSLTTQSHQGVPAKKRKRRLHHLEDPDIRRSVLTHLLTHGHSRDAATEAIRRLLAA